MGVAMRLRGRWYWVTSVLYAALCLWAYPAFPQPRAYVSNEKSNDLTVIDTETDKVIATVPVGERPRGIRLSPDGKKVYLALGEEDRIAVVDTATLRVTEKMPAGTDPEAFDVSPDG
ncbi:MAG: hypothetical protein HYZ81_25165, partial [Nitrospinae bacterium]|nr:hypothetical protein [Nitrospinota bacterium]